MIAARGWILSLFLLDATAVLSEGERVLKQSVSRIQPRQKPLTPFVKDNLANHGEWTTWFNVDHPGGNGDHERLDAIRFYFRDKMCERPMGIEARTTDWVPAQKTGQVVHASLQEGFWCLNKEQPAGKTCLNYAIRFLCPTECNLTCSMGRVNAECDACMCEDHVLHGMVSLADGAPAAEATVYVQSENLKLLTESDRNGGFRIPGVCPDGKNILKIKKARYATVTVPIPESTKKSSIIHVRLKRADKPYNVKNPVDKVRRIGQSVILCCKAVGNPAPDQYLWYHNGTLLDSSVYKYNSKLVLRNLNTDQAGEYFCKASNEAGSVKSQAAKLSVIASDEASCNPRPESYFIRLPHDCFQNATNSFYYDVGKCPAHTCAGKTDKGLQCKDSVAYCCGVSKMEVREISCSGFALPTKVAVECGCSMCREIKMTVRGTATAADNGEPMRFGHIYIGNNRIGMTGYKGTFSVHIPADTERLVLTFVDRLQRFVNTTKVLPFNKKGGAVFHEIKLLRKKAPVTLVSSETNTIPLGDVEGDDPIAELEIPPNTFYRQNGELYTGKVKASVTFLDPRNMSTATAAQSDLNYINEEGDMLPLHTYGMFSMDFTDETATESLNAGKVRVHLDSTQIRIPEHLQQMKLWSLNPETGLWEEEGDFKPDQSTRHKREERIFLVGNMEIRERRLFNLDVPESRRCYVKVRAYRSERFLPSEQVEGAVISLINMEPTSGYSSNPRAWGRFDSAVTGPNGACLPAFCDEQRPDAYSAYILASLGGEELEAVPSSPRFNPNAIGVPQPYLNKLNYRRTDHVDPRIKKTAFSITVAKPSLSTAEESNGPIYANENLRECEQAHYSAAHFRFYRVEGDRYDYNTVPFNENDPMSWTEDYQGWWPNPMEYRACYMKVKINGPQEVNIRSRNMGGTHPYTVGKLYGIRDVRTIRDMEQSNLSTVCLEFKCSGMLYDQDRVDRTLVRIIPQGNCYRESVNSMLQEYLVNHLPLAVNNKSDEYTMLAPLDPLGHNYGIYTVTDQNPSIAKEIALGRCFDGTSDGTSRVMKSNVGIALTFNCAEKEVAQQSLFQSLRNSPRQSERIGIRRQQREICIGQANMRRVTQRRSSPRVQCTPTD
ncbi:cartilage intermediate layer protein 1 isoform X2 [Caretta caretta]|uniref:cartilage intermediate layer protein 1 isoform X2 n=1 Tax=Caretta caretta TaxID=8467 RepID=UPI003F4C9884